MLEPGDIDLVELMTRWQCGSKGAVGRGLSVDHGRQGSDLLNWALVQWPGLLSGGFKYTNLASPPRVKGRPVMFHDDGGDWLWSISDNDDTVYEYGENGAWRQINESVEEFILHLCMVENIINPPAGMLCARLAISELPAVVGPMSLVKFGGWQWPGSGHRIYLGESLMARVGPAVNRTDYSFEVTVWMAGLRESDLSYLGDIDGAAFVPFRGS